MAYYSKAKVSVHYDVGQKIEFGYQIRRDANSVVYTVVTQDGIELYRMTYDQLLAHSSELKACAAALATDDDSPAVGYTSRVVV